MIAKKTNAARLLDERNIPYTLHAVDVNERDLSAVSMAHALHVPPDQVFKTLVARGDKSGVLMACIPGSAELDLKKLAAVSGNKSVVMVALKEVQPLTGYIRGGCSPLAAKKPYPVSVDESVFLWDTIFVSAGVRGVQLQLTPDDLIRACHALYADVCKDSELTRG